MRVLPAIALSAALVAALTLGLSTAGTQHVSAQTYPPPTGNCTLIVLPPNPEVNSMASVTVFLVDTAGDPIPGVAGTATVTPANAGHSIAPTTFVTDENGQATMTVRFGPNAGAVRIDALCGLDLATSATLPVGGVVGPPDTGTGPGSDSGNGIIDWRAGAAASAVALVLAGGALAVTSRRRGAAN